MHTIILLIMSNLKSVRVDSYVNIVDEYLIQITKKYYQQK